MASSRNDKSRNYPANSTRNRLRRFLIESLENRLLLAADVDWSRSLSLTALEDLEEKQTSKASYAYHFNQQPQSMVVLSDRLALDLSPTAEADRSKLAPFGLQLQRELNSEFSVFTSQQPITSGLVDNLKASGLIDELVPVFGIVESRSEAVLLNEVIVALPNGTDPIQFFADSRFESFRRLDGTPDQFVAKLKNGFGPDALEVVNQLSQEPTTAWVAPNFYQDWQRFYIPNDPRFNNLWHLHNTGQGGGLADTDPNLPEAWDVNAGNTASIVVGVVDDGVSIDHADLLNWVNAGEIPNDGLDNDNNGWIDDVNGWNFVTNNNVSFPDTVNDAHGTAVAGVAAARGDNNIGVVGPAYRSQVISARIFRNGAATNDANIASAVYYTSGRTANGLGTFPAAHIVNHSWGGGANSAAITAAMDWASTQGRGGLGAPQLVATGNGFGAVSFPARLSATRPGVIAIGAINNFGQKSDYSNFGPEVDVVAPSNDSRPGFLAIDTTDRVGGAGYAADDYTGTGATGFGGTSSATPLATGIGALTLARAQQLGVSITAAQLKRLFRNNTKLAGSDPYPLPVGRNDLLGYGLINAQTLVSGVGAPKISITTESRVVNDADVINLGQTIIDGTYDVRLRIRNQGTLPLSISQVKVVGAEFTIFEAPPSTLLQLGESTTFTVRLSPTTAGAKLATVNVLSNDSSLATMRFDISSTTVASNISGYFYEDFNGDTLRTIGELGLPGQIVLLDGNSNGIQDFTSFTNSTPVGINDNQTSVSTIAVSGITSAVQDVNITINLTHTWVSDLAIELVSPSGTRVRLFQNRGGSGDNFVNTKFDDQASVHIKDAAAPFTGSFRPEAPLSILNGGPANGNWRLEIADSAVGDTGTLNNWRLDISTEHITSTDQNGFYFFRNLSNGSYNAIGFTPSGYFASGPTQYAITVTNPSNSFRARDFGVVRSNIVYAHAFLDYDRNGARAIDEPGIAQQTFTVTGPQIAVYTNSTVTVIPDNQINSVEVPIVVAAGAGPVQDVEVTINIVHTFVSDLNISLVAPSGQVIDLSSGNGGGGDNFTGTIFDDDAAQSITTGAAPFTGRFRPEQALSLVDGSPASGTWRLRIFDAAALDSGSLLNWSLHLMADQQSTATTGPTGWAAVSVLPGIQTFDLALQPNWFFTDPPTGRRTVNSTGVPVFDQSFGTRPINLPPTINDVLDISINEDAGPQSINLAGITAGRGDSEVLRVSVSSNSTSSITSPSLNYTFPDSTGIIQFTTVPDQSGQTIITVTVEDGGPDNDLTTTADNLTTNTSFMVTVVAVNDQPVINPIGNLIVNEDAPLQTVSFTGVAAGGGEAQSLRVTAVSSNTLVIPHPTVNYVSPGASGTLRFTPLPNTWGVVDITVTVTDAGFDNVFGTGDDQSVITAFQVTVLPINDTPTLNPLPNVTIDEDSPLFTIGLAGITAGPLESQPLRVFATSSNPGLIATPTVNYTSANSTGQLQFIPLPNQFGSAIITVFVEDGGLDNNLDAPFASDNGLFSRTFIVTVLPVQDPPNFDPIADISINEDSLNNIVTITGINAGGGETQPLRIIAKSSVPDSLATLTTVYSSPDPMGTLRIDTLPNQVGTFFISVVLEDGGSDADLNTPADNLFLRRTLNVTIVPVNDPPTIDPVANVVINEDAPQQTIALSGISAGPGESEHLAISITNDNPGLIGTPVLTYTWPSTTGQFRFAPVANKFGTAVVTLRLEDAGPDFQLATTADNAVRLQSFTITVVPVNDPPTLDPIANLILTEDSAAQPVNLAGITAGLDEVQPLRITASSSNPTLIPHPLVTYSSPNTTGSFMLTPQADQSGTAVIVVTVEDGGVDANLSTTADNTKFSQTQTVTVTPVNDTPLMDALANLTVDEDSAVQTAFLSGVYAGGGETQPILVTAVSSNPALVPNPVVNYSSPNASGSLLWAPVANQFGTTIITITVEDGGLDQSLGTTGDNLRIERSFTITVRGVNDQPSFGNLPNLTLSEDSPTHIVNMTGISAGPNETQALRVTVSSSDVAVIPLPTVSYTSPANLGSLEITPAPDRFGTVTITVTVEDAGLDNDLVTTADNSTVQKSFTVTILPVNDTPALTAIPNVVTQEEAEITVSLSGINAGSFESQELRVTATSGNLALLENPQVFYTSPESIAAIRLMPKLNQSGQALITVTVEDGGADNNLLTLADNASTFTTFTITVTPVNDQPTLNPPSTVTLDEDASMTITLAGITAGGGENQILKVSVVTDNNSLLQASAAYTSPQDTSTLELVAQPDKFGSATVIVEVMDGGLDNDLATLGDNQAVYSTFTVVIESVNDAPEIDPVSNALLEEDGQLTISLTGISAGGGELQSVRMMASSSNTALLPLPQITFISPGPSGSLTFVPGADQSGKAIVELTLEDAGDDNNFATNSDNAFHKLTFTVTVNPVNDAPSVDPIADVSFEEDGQLDVTLTGINAGPGETQSLRVSANSSNPSLVPIPLITYNSPNDSAELNITPFSDAFGSAVITVVVEDGGADNDLDTLGDNLSATRTFTVTVQPVNDPPTVDTPSDILVDWNSREQSLGLSGISSGPGETDPIRIISMSSNRGIIDGTAVDYLPGDTDATLRFTPVANQFGAVQIELLVEDGGLDGDLDTAGDNGRTLISFEVLVNAVPVAQSERVRTVRQTSLDAIVLANDEDADGSIDDLDVIIIQTPPAAAGTVSVLPNSRVRFVPAAGFAGVSRFTYVARDQLGAQSASTEVLVGVGRSRLQNPFENLDVNGDGNITASDALLVINLLNDAAEGRLVDELPTDSDDLDVNGDGRITAGDALLVINFLNANTGGGEGESQQPALDTPPRLNDYFFANYEDLGINGRKRGLRR